MRVCKVCGSSAVVKNRRFCKRCLFQSRESYQLKYKKDHYARDREQILERRRRHKEESPERVTFVDARTRARQLGIPFSITLDDVVFPKVCPMLGIPLVVGRGKRTDNSPSLDKIIPSLGYVKGNTVVISWRANRIKNNGTAEDLRRISDWMDKNAPI